ncbi:M20/M25/M40 family metallo-hydrolase [Pseudoneobacillus sp. C159]
METVPSTKTSRPLGEDTKKSVLIFISVIGIILLSIAISFMQMKSPKVVSSDGEATEFSAERALRHLEEFAVAPHPLGSKEHDRVRDYLVQELKALGLSPEIQKATSLREPRAWVAGGTVENIVAKIDGTNSSKAVMLVAHYDSVPGGPGVSDDGAGVAAILETVRALKENQPLKNDVIILLTDGEENGLLGAKAFVEAHPSVQDVGLVLNFEARGNEGPAFMFETSDHNGWLVKEFVKAAPTPVSHSFIYNLYKIMPNDTDLTVFKEAGLNGLNFAFGEGVSHYHTTSDNLEELSKESLQHHGEYMTSLTKHFGQLDLTEAREGNQLFFNIFGSKMITYSEKLVVPFMLLVVLLFMITIVHGYKRKKLTIRGTFGGLLINLGALIGSFGIGLGLWKILTLIFSEKQWMLGTIHTFGTTFLISFSLIVFAFINMYYKWTSKKVMVGSLTLGALFLWLILVVATGILLQAGSYVFTWPLFFALIGVNIWMRVKEGSWESHLVTVGFAVPALLILIPVIYMIQMLVSMSMASVLMVFVALIGSLLVPIFSTLTIKKNWVMPSKFLLAGLVFLVVNSISILNMPTIEHKKASDISYFMNEDTNKAYWVARHPLDDYTSNYISEDVKKGSISEIFPIIKWNAQYAKADLYDMKAPNVTIVADDVEDGKRTIEYLIKTNRQAEELLLQSLSALKVSQLLIDNKEIKLSQDQYSKEEPLLINYVVGQVGEMKVKITVDANDSMEWIVADRSYSIPELKGERPLEYSTYGDNAFVMKTIRD